MELLETQHLPHTAAPGRLKIFFGYAAGVGKTYAMLEAAHQAKQEGVDVVVGYVEPHARPDTLALLEGLETLPPAEIEYHGLRLREFDLDLITTLPSVIYRITKTDGTVVMVDNPHNYPDPAVIELAEEPYAKVSIVSPPDYVGNIMPMCQERRGEFKDMQYLDTNLVELHYSMPLGEIIYDFFDTLKARTKGYASLDYELDKYEPSELVKVDMLLNGDQVDALSFIAHREKAYPRARRLCEKLRDNIPRQLFEVPVQAAIGGKVIARETVKAMRKDVLAKCYGGDISRKKKLLEKQKEGKKKMRTLGTVQLPTEAFMAVLKLDE